MITNSNFLRGLPSSSSLHRPKVRRVNWINRKLSEKRKADAIERMKAEHEAKLHNRIRAPKVTIPALTVPKFNVVTEALINTKTRLRTWARKLGF